MTPPIGAARAGLRSVPVGAIPDSGLLHRYDWSDDSTTTSTVPDLAGDADLTGSFTDLAGSINGVQAGTFDGADDIVDASYADSTQPIERFAVISLNSTANQIIVDGFDTSVHTPYIDESGNFAIFAGSRLAGNAADTNNHIMTARIDGANSVYRVDGTQQASGDAGSNEPNGITAGGRNTATLYYDGLVGEVLDYDPTASGYSRADVEQYLSDKWGVTI